MRIIFALILGALIGHRLAERETPKRVCIPPADPHERTRQQLESYLAGEYEAEADPCARIYQRNVRQAIREHECSVALRAARQ